MSYSTPKITTFLPELTTCITISTLCKIVLEVFFMIKIAICDDIPYMAEALKKILL